MVSADDILNASLLIVDQSPTSRCLHKCCAMLATRACRRR
jgi:hypothetical protein